MLTSFRCRSPFFEWYTLGTVITKCRQGSPEPEYNRAPEIPRRGSVLVLRVFAEASGLMLRQRGGVQRDAPSEQDANDRNVDAGFRFRKERLVLVIGRREIPITIGDHFCTLTR